MLWTSSSISSRILQICQSCYRSGSRRGLMRSSCTPRRAMGRMPGTGLQQAEATRLTLSFRPTPLAPIRVSWVALIEDFHWNERFCDRQLEGPFRYWRHCHRVQEWQSERARENMARYLSIRLSMSSLRGSRAPGEPGSHYVLDADVDVRSSPSPHRRTAS